MTEHTIERGRVHYKWDNSLEPAVEIEPGDTVHCETEEVSDGQVKPGSPASVLNELDFDRLYPLAGPIYVKSAQPGDTLAVEILSLEPLDWGWAGLLPGLGLLAADFPNPYLRHFDLTERTHTRLGDGVRIPIEPFCGTMGVAIDAPGPHQVLPPTKGGGNIDTRHLTAGATLYLPVYVPGALFSAGDCHAAQGDGEVCVTGIESPMRFSLRLSLLRGQAPRPWTYHFRTVPGPPQPRSDEKGYYVVTALGPDLMEDSMNAVRGLIDWLTAERDLSNEDAYILCSLAADLRISQIVDRPNWGVSAYFPLNVLV